MAEGAAPTNTTSAVGTRVKEEALPMLLSLLSPVVCSWDLFVQQIGVPPAQISQIKAGNPQTGPNYLYKCFTQALEWWIANHDNPVYERMIAVLDPGPGKVTPVMNRALAKELREFVAEQRAVMFSTAGSIAHHISPGPHVVQYSTMSMESYVCNKCLERYPTRTDLITDICYSKREHASESKVKLTLTQPIRPVPKVHFRGNSELWNRKRCRGEKCTFPHSIAERDAWKLGSPRTPARQSKPSVFSHPHSSSVLLPPKPQLTSSHAAQVQSQPRIFAEPVKQKQQYLSEPVPTELQRVQQSSSAQSCKAPPLEAVYGQQYRQPDTLSAKLQRPHSDSASLGSIRPEPSSLFHHATWDPYGLTPRDSLQSSAVSGLPKQSQRLVGSHSHPPDKSEWPVFLDSPPQISPASPVFLQGSHPTAVCDNLPMQPPVGAPMQPSAGSQPVMPNGQQMAKYTGYDDYATSRLVFHERLKEPLGMVFIQQELTRANYKKKFDNLLCWEEKAHIHALDDSNGHYPLILYQAGLKPGWMKRDTKPSHKRFGYLWGLNCDRIAYITQASEGAIIVQGDIEIQADILKENFQRIDQQLYVAFDTQNMKKLEDTLLVPKTNYEQMVHVQFELKHPYFNNLHKSLKLLPPQVISRIMPKITDFTRVKPLPIPYHHRNPIKLYTCSADQLHALQTVVSCPSDGPPILITGPFGTGKTRILATIAHYFLREGRMKDQPIRILVCTQQQVSADAFLQMYIDLVVEKERDHYIVCLTDRQKNFKLKRWCKSVSHFRRDFERSSDSSFLIITTCQSSLKIADMFPHDHGFFTHILLDGGAQMREPEGVAPLCMAGKHTKIVIAGDQHQVGPAMLVLGDEAQENGLAVSLLERLQKRYEMMGVVAKPYCATLVTNYRCHEKIVELAEKLFYKTSLMCSVNSNSTHPDAPFPLCFICSSVDDRMKYVRNAKNYKEAEIALLEAANLAETWPVDGWGPKNLSEACFMSTARSQITVAAILVHSKRSRMPLKLRELQKYPTYDIQGREFRALFLSTSEPTTPNGETRNPTKSICDRYVFNTAITRARSLVVSVGNPFMLLKTEGHMIRKYGEEGKCWSQYLKTCLDNGTLSIHSSLGLSRAQQQACIEKLKRLVEERLAVVKSPSHAKVNQVHRKSREVLPKSTMATIATIPESATPTQSTEDENPPRPEIPDQARTKEESKTSHAGAERYQNGKFKEQYKVRQHLGKGGFAVVYHMWKTFDRADYAVKIIRLRRSKSSQDKVLREVHALAMLDHPRIVRYFDSWMEIAPADWRDKEPWSLLSESRSLSEQSHSQTVTGTVTGTVDDSFAATFPSSADTLSQATGGSASEGNADQQESSDSGVEFRDSTSETPKVKVSSSEEAPGTTFLFIQTQLCQKKTLRHWLDDNSRERPRKTIMSFFEQILDAVCYIHKKELIHRDLKPSNIFFSPEDGSIKVGDFGLVTGNIPDPHSLTPPGQYQSPAYRSPAGTGYYMSPEQLFGKKYDEKVDMFALGVIFFELNCPFSTRMERFKLLTEVRNQNIHPTFQNRLPREATLIKFLLEPEPSKRPSAEELYSGTLLQQLKKKIKKSKNPFVTQL